MTSEQLSMFVSPSSENISSMPSEEPQTSLFEPLDTQLADLMIELNGEKSEILKHCTLEISQHTREGQIAFACTPAQQTELLKTNVVGKAGDYKPLILDNDYLYLRRYWQYQQKLAEQIKSRFGEIKTDKEWLKQRLDFYFPAVTDETDWQRIAIERALQNRFLIVSGGPGTGKTTTITRLLCLLIEQQLNKDQTQEKLKILLAAPTGKASIRMLDAINDVVNDAAGELEISENVLAQMPKQASTIHKLLGYIPEKVNFKHNRNNPLNADVVLIDEASMIDVAMMAKLLEAAPEKSKLILIGDKDQLSSVETGSVFADMCEGLKDSQNLVTLQKNWRFAKDSGIGQLAIAANLGESKKLLGLLQDDAQSDCRLLSPESILGNQIPETLTAPWNNYFQILNNPQSSLQDVFQAFNQYRILCALRRGLIGSTIMSSRIETTLAKQGLIKQKNPQSQAQSWYHGRPVMITQNSYSKGLFNGDTGITLIRDGEMKVYFPDKADTFKSLAPVRLPAHETTWAMTIHKSQGSEFDEVTLILPQEVMPLLTKQLIYTGITRAKKKLNFVASEAVLNAGVKTEVVRATQINIS